MTSVIDTPRLSLVAMTRAVLEASLARDRSLVATLLGAEIPEDWPDSDGLVKLRLKQLTREPALEPWLLRAIVQRDARRMIGHIGFHGAPGAPHLAAYAPHAAEFGYTVFTPHRRQGFAIEAARALMAWAQSQRVASFVLSIRPDNAPSLAIAQNLGFRRVGQHIDEEDGLEYVFLWSETNE